MSGRGFAAMTPERRKELARLGGQAAQRKGTGYRWDSETGRAAGHLGGKASGIARKEGK